ESLICVATQISSPATPAAIRVVVPRVSPYMRSPRSVVARPGIPAFHLNGTGLQIDAPRIEMRRIQLRAELLEGPLDVLVEEVLDDADRRIVVPGHVDVHVGDEVDGRPLARGTTHREAERAVAGCEQEERGGKHRPGPLLRVAKEA